MPKPLKSKLIAFTGQRPRYYVLHGTKALPVGDMFEWARAFEKPRIVKQTTIKGVFISTVFLGLDHNYYSSGPPLIFESMVFGGKLDLETRRYSTYEQAQEGHAVLVAAVKATYKRKAKIA